MLEQEAHGRDERVANTFARAGRCDQHVAEPHDNRQCRLRGRLHGGQRVDGDGGEGDDVIDGRRPPLLQKGNKGGEGVPHGVVCEGLCRSLDALVLTTGPMRELPVDSKLDEDLGNDGDVGLNALGLLEPERGGHIHFKKQLL